MPSPADTALHLIVSECKISLYGNAMFRGSNGQSAHGYGASRYSALDAKATYQLAMVLKEKLESMSCNPDGPLGMDPDIAQAIGLPSNAMYSMWDLYLEYWQPFGKLLTDMEAEGFNVDR